MCAGAPWPIQRRRALEILQAFLWPDFLWLKKVEHEDENYDREEQGLERPRPLDEAALYAEWFQWRQGFIQKYQLQTFIPQELLATGLTTF
jgi:hypothetical protein